MFLLYTFCVPGLHFHFLIIFQLLIKKTPEMPIDVRQAKLKFVIYMLKA
jgi:hypothetical protein